MAGIDIKPIKRSNNATNYKLNNQKQTIDVTNIDYEELEDYFSVDNQSTKDILLSDMSSFIYNIFKVILNNKDLEAAEIKMKDNSCIIKTEAGLFYYEKNNWYSNYEIKTYFNSEKTRYSPEALEKLGQLGISFDNVKDNSWIDTKITDYFSNASTKITDVIVNTLGNLVIVTPDGMYEYDGTNFVSFTNTKGEILMCYKLQSLLDQLEDKSYTVNISKDGKIILKDNFYSYYYEFDSFNSNSIKFSYLIENDTQVKIDGKESGKLWQFYKQSGISLPSKITSIGWTDEGEYLVKTNDSSYIYSPTDMSLLRIEYKDQVITIKDYDGKKYLLFDNVLYKTEVLETMAIADISFKELLEGLEKPNDYISKVEKNGLIYRIDLITSQLIILKDGICKFESIRIKETEKPIELTIAYPVTDENGNKTWIYEYPKYEGKYFNFYLNSRHMKVPAARFKKDDSGNLSFIPYTEEEMKIKQARLNEVAYIIALRSQNLPDKFRQYTLDNATADYHFIDIDESCGIGWGGLALNWTDAYIKITDLNYDYLKSAFADTYIHESAHIFDHKSNTNPDKFRFTETEEWLNVYEKVKAADPNCNYVSDYAISNPAELFAEATTEYLSDSYSEVFHNKEDLKRIMINYKSENGKEYKTLYDYMKDIYE